MPAPRIRRAIRPRNCAALSTPPLALRSTGALARRDADSVDGLSTKLSDYASEEGAPLLQPAQHANRVWKEVEKGASRALENQYTQKVLTPVVNYIGELEGLKKLYEARHKKQMDFDYYRRKVQEMQVTIRATLAQFWRNSGAIRRAILSDARSRRPPPSQAKPPRDASKLPRNAAKLNENEAAFTTMSNELRARCAAMLSEKWDFIGAPFTQMLDFQQSFYGNLATAMAPLAPYSSEARLLDAEARCMARETLKTESLVAPVTAAQAGQQRAMNVPQLMGPCGCLLNTSDAADEQLNV